MTKKQIEYRVNEIVKLEAQIKDLQSKEDRYKTEIEAEMLTQNQESLDVNGKTVRYQNVKSSKFDSKLFKKDFPVMWSRYSVPSSYYRFSIM